MRRSVAAGSISFLLVGGAQAQAPVGAGPSTDWTDVMRLSEGTRVVVVGDRATATWESLKRLTIRAFGSANPARRPPCCGKDVVSMRIREVTGLRRGLAILQGAAQMGLTSLANGAALTVLFGMPER